MIATAKILKLASSKRGCDKLRQRMPGSRHKCFFYLVRVLVRMFLSTKINDNEKSTFERKPKVYMMT